MGRKRIAEIGRVRRRHVLLADRQRLLAQPLLDRARVQLDAGAVGRFLRLDQPLVVVARELAVDRQPERRAVVAPARQLDRELDPRVRARHRLDVGRVLLDREGLVEKRLELHFAEHAARLDIAEHAAERADVARQLLHLADAAVHLLEAGGDQGEALAEALLERRVQLLVDGRADLLELLLVVGLDRAEPRLDRRLHLRHPLVERIAREARLLDVRCGRLRERVGEVLLHRRELAAEAVDLLVLRARDVALLREQRLLEERERLGELLARSLGAAHHLVAQLAALAFEAGVDRRPAQRDPGGEEENDGEKRNNEPIEGHPRLSQPGAAGLRGVRLEINAAGGRARAARRGRTPPARSAPAPPRATRRRA